MLENRRGGIFAAGEGPSVKRDYGSEKEKKKKQDEKNII
jgi:hypothetical protein